MGGAVVFVYTSILQFTWLNAYKIHSFIYEGPHVLHLRFYTSTTDLFVEWDRIDLFFICKCVTYIIYGLYSGKLLLQSVNGCDGIIYSSKQWIMPEDISNSLIKGA